MNTCPVEVVMLIVEYACSDDFGQTARRIVLVSKYMQDIAKPIEFRTVAISGLKQLQGAIAQIQASMDPQNSDGPMLDIRHLFISELTAKHAIAADAYFRSEIDDYLPRGRFWRTKNGIKAEASYRENAAEFWNLAAPLVKRASINLKTLFLLSSDNWFPPRGSSWDKSTLPKVLGSLSGLVLPNLVSLTVNHDATAELSYFGNNASLFQSPATPLLRMLHIRSPVFMERYHREQIVPPRIHPLLAGKILDTSALTHLVICEDRMWTAEGAMRAVFGENWRALLNKGTLPGKLQSVILQQGIMPHFGSGRGYTNYRLWTQNFVDNITELQINGLEAHLSTPTFPESGRREYELLLTEWKEQSLRAA